MTSPAPISISEIFQKGFIIPSYQRGYRWTDQEVIDLVRDICDFIYNGANGIYCIQPLVVKEIRNNVLEVIDGQQRLTTINIMLSCLGLPKYSIEYKTREDSQHFLENILKKNKEESDKNIDFHYMFQAKEAIMKLVNELPSNFSDVLLHKVKFIWYETDDPKPINVFTRLNIGRIPLTPAELIKALLLNRHNFGHSQEYADYHIYQQEIAAKWDEIENKLQDDQFWLFFHDDDNYTYSTRIDYILQIITDQKLLDQDISKDIGTDDSRIFRYFYTYFNVHKFNKESLKHVWDKVENIYDILLQWYSDLELYHYIGYLMSRPKENNRRSGDEKKMQERLYSYLQEWNKEGMTITKFKAYLHEQIQKEIENCKNIDADYEINGRLKTLCRPILLLHNILTVIEQGNVTKERYKQEMFYRFPFNLYKKESWNVEHIDSATENELDNYDEQKDWLLSIYIVASEDNKSAIIKFLKEANVEEDNNKAFRKLRKQLESGIAKTEQLDEDKNEKNRLWNFALLDEGTNKGYGNSIFPVKRRVIMGKEEGKLIARPIFDEKEGIVKEGNSQKASSSFIVPCTLRAFMKFYSPISSNMTAWTKADAKAYRQDIIDTLKNHEFSIEYK